MIRHDGVTGLLAGDASCRGRSPVPGPSRWPPGTPAEVLTPPATVAVIATGYRPLLHPSAAAAFTRQA